MVTIVDPDGTLRYANPAWERVLGYDPEEAIGTMNVLDYVHPEDLSHVLEETEKALSEGGVATNEAEYRFKHCVPQERTFALHAPQLLEERQGDDLRVREALEGFVASSTGVEMSVGGVVDEAEEDGKGLFRLSEA